MNVDYIDYVFTTKDLEKWQRNPYINPKTGYKINPNNKKGVTSILEKQWRIHEELKSICNYTFRIPNHIVCKIYEMQLLKNLDNTNERINMIWSSHVRFRKISLDNLKFSRSKEDPFSIPFKTSNEFGETHNYESNSHYLLMNIEFYNNVITWVQNESAIMIASGLYIKLANIKNDENGKTKLVFKYYKFDFPHSSIDKDDQYTIKYGISREFWKNIMPCVQFQLTFTHDTKKLYLDCAIDVTNQKELQNAIEYSDLVRDVQENESHPFLKAYREGFRAFAISITNISRMLKNKGYDDGCHQQKIIIEMVEKMNDILHIKKDISFCFVSLDHLSSNLRRDYLNFIKLKFQDNVEMHNRRINTLLRARERKTIL